MNRRKTLFHNPQARTQNAIAGIAKVMKQISWRNKLLIVGITLTSIGVSNAAVVSWNNNGGSAWTTATNWTSNPALPGTADIATFNTLYPSSNSATITASSQAVAAVSDVGANNITINNTSTTTDSTLTLNGTTIAGQANTILNSASTTNGNTLRLNNGSNKALNVILGNTANYILATGNPTANNNSYGNEVRITSTITQTNAGSSINFLGGGDTTHMPGSLRLDTTGTNAFTGGITVGASDGTNAGRLRISGTAALPTSGTITINPNSQLLIDSGDATFGGIGQNLKLNGGGNLADAGALRAGGTTGFAYIWQGNVSLDTDSAIAVTGATSNLTLSGAISGGGALQKQATGILNISGGSNTYSGATNINSGTIKLTTGDDRLPIGTTVSVGQASSSNLGTFDLNGRNQEIAGLNSNSGTNITASNNTVTSATAATLKISGSGTYSYGDGSNANSGVISGLIGLTKSGTGTQTLGDTNTYIGATAVNGGKLFVNGSLASGSAVTVGTGSPNTGVLGGTGNVAGTVAIASGGSITTGAAVNNVGTLTTGALTFNGLGAYDWNILNATGSPGTNWSQIVAPSLDITSLTSGSPFGINLHSLSSAGTAGALGSFNNGLNQSWDILSTSADLSGAFAANKFAINTTGFLNSLGGGTFSLGLGNSNKDLVLNFTAFVAPTSGNIWDDNGATPGTGNIGGNWTESKWTNDTTGSTATLPFTAGGTPVFAAGTNGTGSYTVNVDTAVSATGITFEEGNVTLAHAGGGSLTLTAPAVSVASGATANISEAIGGSVGLTKTGAGPLNLSGSNTYGGNTAVSTGTLQLGASDVIPDGAGKGNVSVAGTLDLNTFSETVNGLSGAGTVDTIAGGTPTFAVGNNNATSSFSGNIQNTAGSLTLTKTGTGTLTLSGTNSYTGGTNVNGGVLDVTATSALPTSGTVSVASGAQLLLDVAGTFGNSAQTATINGPGIVAGNSGAIRTLSGAVVNLNSNVALGSDSTITVAGGSGSLTINGNVSGAFQLNKAGGGTLILTAANSGYAGSTWLTNGTITVNSGSSLGTGALKMGDDTGSTAVILNLNNSAQTIGSLSQGTTAVSGNAIALGANTALTIKQTADGSYKGAITGATSSVTLDATSTNTLSLTGVNTYGGGTFINGGTLKLGNGNVLLDTGALKVNGGTLDMQNNNEAVAAVTLQNGSIIGTGTLTGTSFDVQNGSSAAPLGGTGVGLTKSAGGTVTLSATNSYTGPTTINGGTLIVNGSIASSSGVTINSGTLGGSGSVGAISGAGLVSPGNSPGILTATSTDSTGGLDYNFGFTQLLNPVWSNASDSKNDVLHLTDATTPIVSSLTASNIVTVDFGLALNIGDILQGGFFTDKNSDFSSLINGAFWQYTFSGGPLPGGASIVRSVVQVASADFAGGTVTNGWVTQFQVVAVPEPSSLLLAGLGVIGLVGMYRRRRTA